jgi:hypothetical protein
MPVFKCPLDRKRTLQLFNLIIILGVIALLITLGVYAYLGFFSRYWADDYCFSALVKNYGLIGGLKENYLSWSNRYTAFLLSAIGDQLGFMNVQFFPGMMIILLAAAITWNVKIILGRIHLSNSMLISILIGEIATFFILFEAPNLFQSLYWRSGMVSYFAPMVLFAVINASVLMQLEDQSLSSRQKWVWGIVSALSVFFAMGTSETFAAFLMGYLFVVGIFLLIRYKSIKKIPTFLYCIILAAFIGGVIIFVSPGNLVRMQYLHPAKDLLTFLSTSTINAVILMAQSARGLIIPNLIVFLIMFFLFYHLSAENKKIFENKQTILFFIGSFILTFWFLFCISAPTVYSMMAFPEPRALILSRAVVIVLIMSLGGFSGMASHVFMDHLVDKCLVSILIIGFLVTFYPLRAAIQTWITIPVAQKRAETWDARKVIIVNAVGKGENSIDLIPMNSVNGIFEITPDPAFWVNKCAADFYGLKTIRAIDRP